MTPKTLPDVRSDKGYNEEAQHFAQQLMACNGLMRPCKDMSKLSDWMEKALIKAYLYGAQSAIGIGYRLADRDWEDTVKFYKQQIEELKKAHDNEDNTI